MRATGASARTPTEYRGRSKRPGRWFLRRRALLHGGVTAAFLGCGAGIVRLLLFADPALEENVRTLYILAGFGGLFGFWSVGYWIRLRLSPEGEHPHDSWPCTRQALLGASGMMAVLLTLRTGHLGIPAMLLIAGAALGAEVALTRLAPRA